MRWELRQDVRWESEGFSWRWLLWCGLVWSGVQAMQCSKQKYQVVKQSTSAYRGPLISGDGDGNGNGDGASEKASLFSTISLWICLYRWLQTGWAQLSPPSVPTNPGRLITDWATPGSPAREAIWNSIMYGRKTSWNCFKSLEFQSSRNKSSYVMGGGGHRYLAFNGQWNLVEGRVAGTL